MIKNERQYKLTRSQAEKFEAALKGFDELGLIKQGLDPILIKAQRDALESQLDTLRSEIKAYDALKSGNVRNLSTNAISDLGKKFIEARIAQGLTQKDLATRLDMKEQQIQRYEKEQYASASLDRLVEVADALGVAMQLELSFKRPDTLLRSEEESGVDARKLPLKVIRDRRWLNTFRREEGKAGLDYALSAFMAPVASSASPALLRQGKRSGATLDEFALLAWKARIIWKARRERLMVTANFSDLSWLNSIKEFTQQDRGPALAIEFLRTKGILVLFEAHLPKTQLDGAAMLVDDHIFTIAMTLRYDRLDNFWFVLLHELGHIIQHRDSGLQSGFFDEDGARAVDKLEKEADDFARSTLLPAEFWLSSLIRFSQSEEQVVEFAKENRISAAVIAGWIRRERNDFTIFNSLVGHGKVRNVLRDAGLLEDSNVSGP